MDKKTKQMSSRALAGLKVLVTRPSPQQRALVNAIEMAAGKAIHLPLIEIKPLVDAGTIKTVQAKIQVLDNYHILIFISTNAARYGAEWIDRYWPEFPVGIAVIAIGPSTAAAVTTALNCEVISAAAGMTSEDLLKLPVLIRVDKKRVGIFRGRGGRELLAETLLLRGAKVDYFEVYERCTIPYEAEEFYQQLQSNSVNVITLTSTESLNRLLELLGDNKQEMSLLPLLVPSARIAEQARQAGFKRVVNTQGADEVAFMAALRSLIKQ